MNHPTMNHQIVLSSRPKGMPTESNFALREARVPEPKEGEILIKALYISVDPYMRGRMEDRPSYLPPFQINHPASGGVVGKVVQSNNANFKKGDFVSGFLDWSEYSISNGKELQKIDDSLAPISTYLGILGIPGISAYFGLLEIGKPQAGETVVVSGAAGAVGSCVAQIAKLKGCRVIGIVGSKEKIDYLVNDLKIDAAVNYKSPDFEQKLKDACPKGVDVYFDNVGDTVTNSVLNHINKFARIIICGQISLYNMDKPGAGIQNVFAIMVQSATIKGFLVLDYLHRFPEAISQLAQWIAEGKLQYKETVSNGLSSVPGAFVGLFTGQNTGKQIVKL